MEENVCPCCFSRHSLHEKSLISSIQALCDYRAIQIHCNSIQTFQDRLKKPTKRGDIVQPISLPVIQNLGNSKSHSKVKWKYDLLSSYLFLQYQLLCIGLDPINRLLQEIFRAFISLHVAIFITTPCESLRSIICRKAGTYNAVVYGAKSADCDRNGAIRHETHETWPGSMLQFNQWGAFCKMTLF